MHKNKGGISLVFCFLFRFNLSNACSAITNFDLREFASSLTESTGNVVDFEEIAQMEFQLIQPGTKWCGAGNVAENYDDLGSEWETDMCCRDHDNCPDILEAGESRHNLTNDAYYTRLSCECDEKFRTCLRAVKRTTSKSIGNIYFNVLGTKCYREDYPTVRCEKRGGWLKRKCLEYSYDTSANKIYQWFDVNDF